MSDDSKKMDDWLQLLSDEQRADVMKTHIAETEATKRKAIEEREQSRRDDIKTDGYHGYRIAAVCAVICAIAGATCVGYQVVDVRRPAAPVPSASSGR